MYKVTTDEKIQKAYEDAIYSYNREFQLELLVNNKQIPSCDILDRITIDYDGMTNGLTVGEIIYPKLSFSVLSQHKIKEGDKISVTVSVKIKNPYNRRDMWLSVPFGKFEVESVESDKFKHTVSTYADGYLKMQETFYPKASQYSSSSLLAEISSNTGLVFEGFPNISLANEDIVTEGEDGNSKTEVGTNFVGHTYASIIGLVAGACVGNVVFNRNGNIKFVSLSHLKNPIETLKDVTEPTLSAPYDKRKVSVLKRSEMPTINSGDTYANGIQILDISNPLFVGQQQVDSLCNIATSIKYTSMSATKCYSFPLHLDPLDSVNIVLDGVTYLLPLMKYSFSFGGGVLAELGSYASTSSDNHTGTLTSQVDGLGKVTSQILHEQNRIELSVSHIKENYSTKEETNSKIEVAVGEIKLEVAKTYTTKEETEELSSRLTLTAQEIRAEVKDTKEGLESLVSQTASEWSVQLNNTKSSLESSIKVNADNISLKVSKGDVISSINQSSEKITINANKINFNGMVVFNKDDSGGNRDEYIKIEDANYTIKYGNATVGYFGMRDIPYDDYRIPRFALSSSNGVWGDNNDYFVINPYRANKENPSSYDYPYVDIAYHSSTYDDWSNIKMFGDGIIRLSALTEVEIRSNAINGKYAGTGEKLVAKFGTSSEDQYNGYLQIGAIQNTTNNNGLILEHLRSGTETRVRVHTDSQGLRTLRPADQEGNVYCGSSGYPWYGLWSVSGSHTTSDSRYKAIVDEVNLQDCYDMIKNTKAYNYVALGKNKEEMNQLELAEAVLCNEGRDNAVQMGIMAQDILDYECASSVLNYDKDNDKYTINDYGFATSIMGALKHEIQLRDAQMKMLEDKIELLKNEIKSMRGE